MPLQFSVLHDKRLSYGFITKEPYIICPFNLYGF